MTGTVPAISIIFMALSLLVSIALPLGLCIYFHRGKKADLLPFFVGCGVMILFAFTLESIAHQIVLGSAAGRKISENIWLYGLYGGAMAGLFEETGRLLAFRTLLRKKMNNNANALMYGAGHGGIEALLILGIASVNNLIYSLLINTGNTAVLTAPLSGDMLTQVEKAIELLITTPSWQFLLGSVERILAVALQISLSVLVWFAAKRKDRRYLYPAAILIHLTVDAGTAILSKLGISVILIEVMIAVFTVMTVFLAKKIYE